VNDKQKEEVVLKLLRIQKQLDEIYEQCEHHAQALEDLGDAQRYLNYVIDDLDR